MERYSNLRKLKIKPQKLNKSPKSRIDLKSSFSAKFGISSSNKDRLALLDKPQGASYAKLSERLTNILSRTKNRPKIHSKLHKSPILEEKFFFGASTDFDNQENLSTLVNLNQYKKNSTKL